MTKKIKDFLKSKCAGGCNHKGYLEWDSFELC
jgi:hypothetical protein